MFLTSLNWSKHIRWKQTPAKKGKQKSEHNRAMTKKTEIDKGKEECDTNEVYGGGTKLKKG
jgi:hypothetical protein